MDFPKRSDLARIAADAMLLRQRQLSISAVEREGSDVDLLIAGIAAMGEEIVRQHVLGISGAFFDSATKARLARVIIDRTGLAPKTAGPARVQVAFATATPNPTPFTLPVGIRLAVATGQQFVTTQSTTFPLGSTGPVLVDAQSTVAGKDQQIAAGPISIVSTVAGAPGNLTCSAPAASAGVDDAETDDQYRSRGRKWYLNVQKGTMEALEQAALAVAGVTTAKAIQVIDTLGRPQQMIELSVTDKFTPALIVQGATPPAYATQSQALARTVWQALQNTVAGGAYLRVQVAKVTMLPITLQLRFRAGADYALSALVARMTMVLYSNSLRSGQKWIYDDAIARLRTVQGLDVQGDEIAVPAGDVVPSSGFEVLRTDPSICQTSAQTAADIGALNIPNTIPVVS